MSVSSLVKQELQNLRKELSVLSLVISQKDKASLDDIEVRGAALSLGSLYNGMERVLKQLLLDRNTSISDSPNWHSALLQKSAELRIISQETMDEMKGFLGFRHFVRHAYSFEINPKAIGAILDLAPELVQRFITEVEAFGAR